MEKISVIMGIYNGAKTLHKSIDSIINQTNDEWVMIVCDDCSSDNTFDLLKEYERKYPQKFVIIQNSNNMGLAYSLNHCLQYVNTEYIARMDDDDISEPERFEKELQFLETHKDYGIVGSNVRKFDETGIWGEIKHKEYPEKSDFLWNTPFVHPTVMIRSSVLKKAGGYSDSKYTRRCEDYELFGRIYSLGVKGYNIQEYLLKYFEGKESYVKRKFKYNIYAIKVRHETFKRLKLYPRAAIFLLKPIAVGLIRHIQYSYRIEKSEVKS